MLKKFNPPTIRDPGSSYFHGVEVPPDARFLFAAGQVGGRKDGSVGKDFAEQASIAWDNVLAILSQGGMGPEDIVKITSYLTNPKDVAENRTIRDGKLGGHKPASTLLIVAGLASPELLFEVDVVAAKAAPRN